MREFIGTITPTHGLSCAPLLRAELALMPVGKRIALTLKEHKKTRSNRQNRYMFGVVIEGVLPLLEDSGALDKEDAHEYLLKRFAPKKVIKGPDGEPVIVPKRSKDMSTDEMEQYLEKIRAFAAQWGVQIPLPNESIDQL